MNNLRGRSVTLVALATLAVLAAGGWTASAQEPRFDGLTLRVGTWGGSWKDAIHDLIGREIEKRGARVEYVIGNPRDNLAKLIAARGREVPFDVFEIDDGVKQQLADSQLLAELNFAKLPNTRDLDPIQKDRIAVAALLSQEGIVYHARKFEELGIPKPERYKDLLNPKLAGRVSFPDINVGMVINGIVGFAADGGGDETNIDPGLDLIRQLKLASFYKSSVELSTKFSSGDVWAAVWHAGWALRVKRTGVPVAMAFPKVKNKRGMLQITWEAIPEGGKARPAAEFFVNRYLDPDVQAEMARKVGLVPVKKAALSRLAEDPELKAVMLLNPGDVQNLYFPDFSKFSIAEWGNKWNRTMAR